MTSLDLYWPKNMLTLEYFLLTQGLLIFLQNKNVFNIYTKYYWILDTMQYIYSLLQWLHVQ